MATSIAPRARDLDQVAERRFAKRTARSGQQQLDKTMHRVQRRARIVHQESDQLAWTRSHRALGLVDTDHLSSSVCCRSASCAGFGQHAAAIG
jgi:hypothetical protein